MEIDRREYGEVGDGGSHRGSRRYLSRQRTMMSPENRTNIREP